MRNKFAIIMLVSVTCIAGAPAVRAQTVGVGPDFVSVDEARDIAAFNGVIAIRRIELDEGYWKIEGHDRSDRRVEMKIDPRTGEIAELERFD